MRIMEKRRKSCKERICALLLALALVLTGIMPGSAVTVEAAEAADVIFSVKDTGNSDSLLSKDITINILNADKEIVETVTDAEPDGTYIVSGLTADTEYAYEVTKSGYEYSNVNVERKFTPTESGTNSIDVAMKMSEISLSQTGPLSLEVGKSSAAISVNNKVSGLTYSWSVISGSDYVEVTPDSADASKSTITAKAGGSAGDDADKTATVQVSNGTKTANIEVTVKKISPELSLSVEPGEGKDENQVTLTANIPDDATGDLTFKIGGEQEKEVKAETSHSVIYSDADINIYGEKNFTVEYSGDTKYKKDSAESKGIYNKTKDLLIDGESEKEVTYGADAWDEEISISFGDTLAGRTLSKENITVAFLDPDDPANSGTPEQVAEVAVAEDGSSVKVTPKNAGKIKISITAVPGQGVYYLEDTVDFILTVNRATVKLENITWDIDQSKVYDGKKDFILTGTVAGETITVNANTESADVAADETGNVIAQNVEIPAKTYYTTVESDTGVANRQLVVEEGEDNIVESVAKITYRPVYLTAKDVNVSLAYGQNLKTALEAQTVSLGLLNDNGNSGLIEGEQQPSLPGATISGDDTRLSVGKHQNIVIPNITEENRFSGNYEFKFDEAVGSEKGTLTVTQQTINREELLKSIYLEDSANLYDIVEDGSLNKIYASVGGVDEKGEEKEPPYLKLRLQGILASYYDQIIISFGDEDAADAATENGISLDGLKTLVKEETDEEAVENVKIYLAKSGAPETVTNTVVVSDWLSVDNKAPVANIVDYTPTAYSKMANALTFGMFTNKSYTATIDITDGGSGLSQTEAQKYCVYKLGKLDDRETDIADRELSKGEIGALINEINQGAGEYKWKEIPQNKQILVGEGTSKEELENNYLIFIRTIDNAGNCAVYVSNGIVIEQTPPTINVNFEKGENSSYIGESQDENGIITYEYQGSAEYTLTIEDPGDYFSGISQVDVTVTKDGARIDGEGKLEEGCYVNSFMYQPAADINSSKPISIKGVIPCETITSNDIQVEVTATDRAGNISEIYKCKIVMDITPPVITVEYNDDKNPAKNGYYFNNNVDDPDKKEPRTMTITYKERNMKIDENGNYTGISFDVIKDGKKYTGYSLEQLGEIEIGWDGKVEDSQSDRTKCEYTEERECKIVLTFSEDGEYTIIPKCVDTLENENDKINYTNEESKANEHFIIDTEAPIINVKFDVGTNPFKPKTESYFDAPEDGAYSQKPVTATIEITEKNFWEKGEDGNNAFAENQFDFEGTAGVNSGKESIEIEGIEVKDYYFSIASSGWSTNQFSSSTYSWVNSSFEFGNDANFENDANYTFQFTYTDLAGNVAEYSQTYSEQYFFTVDQKAPDGSAKVKDKDDMEYSILTDLFNLVTFNIFRNTDYEVSLCGTDETSGVKSIEYIYIDPNKEGYYDASDLETATWNPAENIVENTAGCKKSLRGNFKVSPDQQFVVYEKITDYAEHVTYKYPSEGMVADSKNPEISYKCINQSEAHNNFFNEDVQFSTSVKDPSKGGTYSGIKRIWYTVAASGNGVSEKVTENDDKSKLFTATGETDLIQNDILRENEFTIEAEDFNCNDVRVQIHAEDLSGNIIATEEIPIKIDITKPEISVSYNNIPAVNGDYYNATRVATVTVTERNFDPSGVRFNITNTEGVQPSISGWTAHGAVGVSDEAYHTCTVTFAADGDYTFTLNATDLAGNTSNYTRVDEFTIDQTDPTIQVTYDNNNDAEPGYFNASRTATVTINEHNFNAADVNAMITASLQGSGASVPRLGGWTTRGDSHTASVTFSADADYTFDIEYTDMAGNAAADYTQDSFTIDQTAPEIEFFDIEDKSANNGTVAPGVRYSDINYTADGVEITLEGAENGITSIDGTRSSIPNGQSIKMADFAHEEAVDDVYTMTASVTDRAGNTTEQSVMFSVNRFGSNYIMSEATEKLIEDVYTNEEQELVVTEINVDTLVFNGITYGRDGNLVTLEEGKDYNVSESGSEESWKRYTYTINKENFETEGNYTVTIESEDRAKNVSSTQTKQVQSPTDEKERYDLNFVIDKTAPTVVITGIEDGGQYRANTREITVNAADNIAMGEVGVYLGNADKPEQTYSAEALQAAGGEVTYTMSNSNSRQDVRAVAVDAAGNTSETEIRRVLVTSNLFVQFYSNTPLLAGSIAGIVVIAAALWYFLIFKRKKKEEEQANSR